MIASWRWIRVILPLFATAAVLVGISILSMNILSSVRAFVGGESLYSKAQKEAVLHLTQYVSSHHIRDYQLYLKAIEVPIGDRKARLALDRPQPDLEMARQGFLVARNHPDDIDGMIWLFRTFRNVRFMSDVIAIWAEADNYIAALSVEAGELHATIQSGGVDDAALQAGMARIMVINAQLNSLEEAFSSGLGQASRKTQLSLMVMMLGIASAMMVVSTGISRSILEKKDVLVNALRISEERLNLAMRASNDGLWDWDILHKSVYYSPRLKELLEVDSDESAFSMHYFLRYIHAEDRHGLRACLKNHLLDNTPCAMEFRVITRSGKMRWVGLRAQSALDTTGKPFRVAGSITDITERKEAEREIQQLAFYDPLTLLPNRRLLMERLHEALVYDNRRHKTGALLFIDLDNFKAVNDTFGHDLGDLLLQQVALRLTGSVRASDTVARLGGDEFVIMLFDFENHGPAEAAAYSRTVGEKILAVLAQPYQLDGTELHSTASIGIALFNSRLDSVSELLKNADLLMFEAKAAGRNTLRFLDPHL